MKLKYHLRGLGVGIVVTGLIFTIANANKSETLTDIQMIQKAQELGMVTKDDYDLVKKDLDVAKASIEDLKSQLENTNNSQNMQQNEQDNLAQTPQADSGLEDTTNDAENSTDASSNNDTTKETNIDGEVSKTSTVKFTIEPGMGSEAVAKLLEQKGIVDSAAEFNKYVVDSGNAYNLQVGEFEISTDDSYDVIMDKITGQ